MAEPYWAPTRRKLTAILVAVHSVGTGVGDLRFVGLDDPQLKRSPWPPEADPAIVLWTRQRGFTLSAFIKCPVHLWLNRYGVINRCLWN